jgi:hypothetical protein
MNRLQGNTQRAAESQCAAAELEAALGRVEDALREARVLPGTKANLPELEK